MHSVPAANKNHPLSASQVVLEANRALVVARSVPCTDVTLALGRGLSDAAIAVRTVKRVLFTPEPADPAGIAVERLVPGRVFEHATFRASVPRHRLGAGSAGGAEWADPAAE
jgi:hypothetical protein